MTLQDKALSSILEPNDEDISYAKGVNTISNKLNSLQGKDELNEIPDTS